MLPVAVRSFVLHCRPIVYNWAIQLHTTLR